jgi:aldehyde dehydrogenase (NAD+)
MESRHWINNEVGSPTRPSYLLSLTLQFITSEAKEKYEVRSPFDDHVVGSVPFADNVVVDKAVAAARAAYEGKWSTWTPDRRAKAMLKFADLVETKADEIGKIESASIGQPVSLAKVIIKACAQVYRYYAGWADKIAGESYKEESGAYRIVQYEPLGVCAGIAAWLVLRIIYEALLTLQGMPQFCSLH